MALCQLPNIVTSTSSKVYFPPLFFSNREKHLQGFKYHHLHAAPSWKRLAFVCSAKKHRISKRVKLPRTNMSDADLCNDIRDFVSKEGLPGNYIPSIAELSRRGRKDLADIVKRKGYRKVAGLLMNKTNKNTHLERKLDVDQDSLTSVLESTGLWSHQKATSFSSNENIPRDNDSDEMLPSATFDANIISEVDDFKKDYEINHLKTVLSQKETELLLLKNDIKKEKLALSKTNAEISNIQNLILAKDAELRAAEEDLLGLKEVHIEYQAHGDAVEVTGSFNGWHHRLKMERYSSPINQASSKLRLCQISYIESHRV